MSFAVRYMLFTLGFYLLFPHHRVVVNRDFPTGVEDYVHRIGRTGRAGATGVSYNFFSDPDWRGLTSRCL